jgi:DNA-binding transcriptional LysR family regulator
MGNFGAELDGIAAIEGGSSQGVAPATNSTVGARGKRATEASLKGASLRQLRAFALVARHLSFGKAAAELHLTPSAVSLQIKELEQIVGLPLFVRDVKSVSVTRAGEMLLADVVRALKALRDADETLARLHGQHTGVVTIGMVKNAKYFLPRLLSGFGTAQPGVELRFSFSNREHVVRQLGSGAVDMVVMGTPPSDLDVCADAFAPQALGIVASPEHPLAAQRAISVAALADEGFIVRETGSGTRAAMERFFHDADVAPARIMEMNSNEVIKQAVIANMGLAFLSLQTSSLELQRRQMVHLDVVGLPIVRRWYVVHRRSAQLSEAARSLRQVIIEHGGALLRTELESLGIGDPMSTLERVVRSDGQAS